MLETVNAFLKSNALPAVVLLVIGVFCIRLILMLITRILNRSKLEKAAHSLIRSLVNTALYILLGLMVASSLGVDVTGIVALASVLTLAVSLAVQNALTNIISGFTLLYTKPFHSGDYVEIAGQSGTVTEINLTYTKLATPDNKVVSIPNSAVTAAQIVNYSIGITRRVDLSVSASYASSVDAVLACLLEAAQLPAVLDDPAPFTAVQEYGSSAIVYTLKVWCKAEDYWDVYFEINKRIKEIFDQRGVAMTYPHLNVHLDK